MVKSIAFASGKGGVGKTSVCVNVAILLAKLGFRVSLLDADFGMANSHIMLDMKIKASLADLLDGDAELAEILCETSTGIKLIPGGSGHIELLNLDKNKRWKIIRAIDELRDETDFLLVDTPAGGSDATIDFAAACDEICVVLVGEPTSFMDAYSLIKAMNLERKVKRVSIVVNLAASEANARTIFNNFVKATAKFINIELEFIGWLPKSNALQNSIVARKPITLSQNTPDRQLMKCLDLISSELQKQNFSNADGIKFFSGGG
ncbi:MAG: MinD/ParA family protein [Flavobacteriaceae bacterium]|jgi:flagellar biosynthesis protein FlhG|nr:MinD/ParA family protein [Flavobacteriaceae bacterium]